MNICVIHSGIPSDPCGHSKMTQGEHIPTPLIECLLIYSNQWGGGGMRSLCSHDLSTRGSEATERAEGVGRQQICMKTAFSCILNAIIGGGGVGMKWNRAIFQSMGGVNMGFATEGQKSGGRGVGGGNPPPKVDSCTKTTFSCSIKFIIIIIIIYAHHTMIHSINSLYIDITCVLKFLNLWGGLIVGGMSPCPPWICAHGINEQTINSGTRFHSFFGSIILKNRIRLL